MIASLGVVMFMMNDIGHLIGSGRPDQQPASLYEVGNKLVKVIQEKTVTPHR